jgi:hypothetical protein
MTKYGMQEHMRPRECVQEWNTLSQVGENTRKCTLMIPKRTPMLGVAFMQEFQIFRTLIEKENKH